ncbi:hypothetical protein KIW84_050413 [Lathyrus oleraceus]|uniref:Uncharacterized protein n=1 Tax=Pisum sativum TaxID=3888 RepID=A0A9D4WJN6_PEA|nr:hypothetical protein KIW84_050413 [Pisum sativum]
MTSSDTESYQIQIIRRSEASEVETRSRSSNSEQNSRISEASEEEVHPRSSDSEQRHASTNAVKLPIAFPSIICGIILSQQPGILNTSDIPSRRKPPLSIYYKLFEGSHVNDIVMTSARKMPTSQGGLITELKETCKELETRIRVAKARKKALEVLISSLE